MSGIGSRKPPFVFRNGGIKAKSSKPSTDIIWQNLPRNICRANVQRLRHLAQEAFPDMDISVADLDAILECLVKAADEDYGMADAIAWAKGFRFPIHLLSKGQPSKDMIDFGACDRDLAALVLSRHAAVKFERLSTVRVKAWVPVDDPDHRRIMEFAEVGVRILTDPEFVPNERPPPMRDKYRKVASAVNKLLFDLNGEGVVIMLPTSLALTIPGVHFSCTHWATKRGKPKGRPIGDYSNNPEGCNLNTEAVPDIVEAAWGEIHHPTIQQIVDMILRAADRFDWDGIMLWKLDLKVAFHLIDIRPEDVRLMAYELTDDLTLFYTRGMFGWTESPFMFQVITRVLSRLITRDIGGVEIVGEIVMYADDIMGVSPSGSLESDMSIAMDRIKNLLGPKALAEDKVEKGRALDMIGWRIDLEDHTVTLAEHNMRKTMYGFMSVDLDKGKLHIEHARKLASYASRYVEVCRYMKPFSEDLNALSAGHTATNVYLEISAGARWSIELWRVFLFVMRSKSMSYRRRLESFAPRPPVYLVEFDASLKGMGLVISSVGEDHQLTCSRVVSLSFRSDGVHMSGSGLRSASE